MKNFNLLARSSDDLDAKWFTQLLSETSRLCEENHVTYCDVDAIGTGQMGYVVKASLQYASPDPSLPASLIIKLSSPNEQARQTGLALGIYEAEVNFYTTIAPKTQMQLPQCLHAVADEAGWLTIVLDDMSGRAEPGDVLVGGTVALAKQAMSELAMLQAPFWNSSEHMQLPWLAPENAAPLFDVCVNSAELFLERFGPMLEEAHTDIIKQIMPQAVHWFSQWQQPMSISHGDFRLDNMLIALDYDAAVSQPVGARPITTIDWQTVRMAPPMLDVAYYLGVCLSTEDRRNFQDEILEHYQAVLRTHGIDYKWEQLWRDYRYYSVYGLLLCAFLVQVPQTQRGEAMAIKTTRAYAEMVLELDPLALINNS